MIGTQSSCAKETQALDAEVTVALESQAAHHAVSLEDEDHARVRAGRGVEPPRTQEG